MNHSQVEDLLPGYALGALEMREQDDLLKHLQTCSACYNLALEQMELAAMLAGGVAEVDPPVGLRARVYDSLAEMPTLDEAHEAASRPSIFTRIVLAARRLLRLILPF